MAAEDYLPEGWEEHWYTTRTAQTISCRHCKKKPMFWKMDSDGWYMTDKTGTRHDCRGRRNADEELETLDEEK